VLLGRDTATASWPRRGRGGGEAVFANAALHSIRGLRGHLGMASLFMGRATPGKHAGRWHAPFERNRRDPSGRVAETVRGQPQCTAAIGPVRRRGEDRKRGRGLFWNRPELRQHAAPGRGGLSFAVVGRGPAPAVREALWQDEVEFQTGPPARIWPIRRGSVSEAKPEAIRGTLAGHGFANPVEFVPAEIGCMPGWGVRTFLEVGPGFGLGWTKW